MPCTAIDLAPPMPIYEYLSKSPDEPGSSCRICSKGFELFRPIDREALENCPMCKNAVRKVISKVSSPRTVAKPFSTSDAKKAGFTVLEKRDTGVYEKM